MRTAGIGVFGGRERSGCGRCHGSGGRLLLGNCHVSFALIVSGYLDTCTQGVSGANGEFCSVAQPHFVSIFHFCSSRAHLPRPAERVVGWLSNSDFEGPKNKDGQHEMKGGKREVVGEKKCQTSGGGLD